MKTFPFAFVAIAAFWGVTSQAGCSPQQIENLYEFILNRPADPGGLIAWSNSGLDCGSIQYSFAYSAEAAGDIANDLYMGRLGRAASGAEVAAWQGTLYYYGYATIRHDIAFSPEGQLRIIQSYETYLARNPESQGAINYWASFNESYSLANVHYAIGTSTEAQNDVTNFYLTFLLRMPEAGAVNYWTNYNVVYGLGAVANGIAYSTEAQNYVTYFYSLYLLRSPEAGAVAYWTGINRTYGLNSVKLQIAESVEAQNDITYFCAFYLLRNPAAGEVAAWVAQNESFGLNAVKVAIATGQEARNDFASSYQRYLGRGASDAEISAWTTFSFTYGLALAERNIGLEAVVISSFYPTQGASGQTVTLTGLGFTGASSVTFNGYSASFTENSASSITATVPAGASSGLIIVTSPNAVGKSSSAFTVLFPPAISSFSPTQGSAGQSVTLTGSGFTAASSVTFNGTSARFTLDSATCISAIVPVGASTGLIAVTTSNGTAKSATNFSVSNPTVISSFTPAQAAVGQTVLISGSAFTGATSVAFNGVNATFTLDNASSITATVPPGSTTGKITVTTPSGTGTSASTFTENDLCSPSINASKELVITDLSVVNDPRTKFSASNPGHWSIGFLMGQLAGETNFGNPVITSNFVKHWLNQFSTVTTVPDGNPVTPRSAGAVESFLSSWPTLADGTTLDFSQAPFRLLAMTHRVDLQNANQAGEGRFVWNVLSSGFPQEWTVIFEFSLPLTATLTQGTWTGKWHALGALPFDSGGDDRFNTALQTVTDLFAATSYPGLGFVRNVALNQLRTNELALSSPWELREFRMNPTNQLLEQSMVKQTPDLSFNSDPNKIQKLENFIAANGPTAIFPNNLSDGTPFLGGAAPVPGNDSSFTWFPGSSDPNIRKFALNTCNGCHAGETGTSFLHLNPRSMNQVSTQSAFLANDITTNRIPIEKSTLITNFCN